MALMFLTKRVTRIPHYIGSTTRTTGSYPFSSANQGPTTDSELGNDSSGKPVHDSSSPTSFAADTGSDYRRKVTDSLEANWRHAMPLNEKGPPIEYGLSIDLFDDLSSFKNCFGTRQKVMYTHKDSWKGNWSLARASPKKVPSTVSEGVSQPFDTAEQRSVRESVKSDDNH